MLSVFCVVFPYTATLWPVFVLDKVGCVSLPGREDCLLVYWKLQVMLSGHVNWFSMARHIEYFPKARDAIRADGIALDMPQPFAHQNGSHLGAPTSYIVAVVTAVVVVVEVSE